MFVLKFTHKESNSIKGSHLNPLTFFSLSEGIFSGVFFAASATQALFHYYYVLCTLYSPFSVH